MHILLLFLCALFSYSALATSLDAPISSLVGDTWKNLGIDSSTPVRTLVKAGSPYNSRDLISGHNSPVSKFREKMARLNLPTNLSERELQHFEQNPKHPLYVRLRDVPRQYSTRPLLVTALESRGVMFVRDFLRAYAVDLEELLRIEGVGKASLFTMDSHLRDFIGQAEEPALDLGYFSLEDLGLSPETVLDLQKAGLRGNVTAAMVSPVLDLTSVVEIAFALSLARKPSPECQKLFDDALKALRD